MIRHVFKSVALLGLLAIFGCSTENGLQPVPSGGGSYESPVYTTLKLTPDSSALTEAQMFQLGASALDQNGAVLMPHVTASYVSDAPAVASVTRDGFVIALEPGIARITATASIGSVTKSGTAFVRVLSGVAADTVVLQPSTQGWQPSVAYLNSGGLVIWSLPPAGSYAVGEKIWIMNYYADVMDSVTFKDGSAVRRFNAIGKYLYCTGTCWDSSDWGTIVVK